MVRSNPGCQPLKEVHRPVLLLGPWTSYVGTPEQCPKEWVDQTVGRNKHTIVECSDPSTGLRYASSAHLRHDSAAGDVIVYHPIMNHIFPSSLLPIVV